MLVKALTSFSGAVSMSVNEVRDISDEVIRNDLLHAGYVVPANPQADAEKNIAEFEKNKLPEDPAEPEELEEAAEPEELKKGRAAKKK